MHLIRVLISLSRPAAFSVLFCCALVLEAQPKPLALRPETLVSMNVEGGRLRCEPSVAAAENTIIVAWNDSYGGRHRSPTGVAIAWALSKDRGKTFEFGGYLPLPSEAAAQSGADSVLLADSKGNFWMVFVNQHVGGQSLLLYEMTRQRPGEWLLRSKYSNRSPDLSLIDRPSMYLDSNDHVWISFTTRKQGAEQIALISSLDAGETWTPPRIVSTGPVKAKLSSQIIVQGKTIRVAWVQFSARREGDMLRFLSTGVWQAVSRDLGKTFSQPLPLYSGRPPSTVPGYVMGFRPDAQAQYVPNLVIGPSRQQDQIEVVTDLPNKHGYVVFEGGLPSGPLKPVFSDRRSTFFPAAVTTRLGLAVLAYCRLSDTTVTDVCFSLASQPRHRKILILNSRSTDWSKVPGDSEAAPMQRNFGDYISLAATKGYLVAVWTDGRDGAPRIFSRVIEVAH